MICCAIAEIHMVDALNDTMIILIPMLLAPTIVWLDLSLFFLRLISPAFLR